MLHFAFSVGWFPLTLTLSFREREQRAADSWLADGCWPNAGPGVSERLWIILPLPRERAGVRGNRVWPSRGRTRMIKGRCPAQAQPKRND